MKRKGLRVHYDPAEFDRIVAEQEKKDLAMYDRLRRANAEERREIADRNFVFHGLEIEIVHEPHPPESRFRSLVRHVVWRCRAALPGRGRARLSRVRKTDDANED